MSSVLDGRNRLFLRRWKEGTGKEVSIFFSGSLLYFNLGFKPLRELIWGLKKPTNVDISFRNQQALETRIEMLENLICEIEPYLGNEGKCIVQGSGVLVQVPLLKFLIFSKNPP